MGNKDEEVGIKDVQVVKVEIFPLERFSMVKEYPIVEFRTVKGKGLKRFENELGGHYWSINNDDLNEYKKDLF